MRDSGKPLGEMRGLPPLADSDEILTRDQAIDLLSRQNAERRRENAISGWAEAGHWPTTQAELEDRRMIMETGGRGVLTDMASQQI